MFQNFEEKQNECLDFTTAAVKYQVKQNYPRNRVITFFKSSLLFPQADWSDLKQ